MKAKQEHEKEMRKKVATKKLSKKKGK